MKFFNLLVLILMIGCSTVVKAQPGAIYSGDLTFLPDGVGVPFISTMILTDYPGIQINSLNDLEMIYLSMEHSYIGDLEVILECPNGSQVTLLNYFDPGFIVGGCSNAPGTAIGNDRDIGGGQPGTPYWKYYFSETVNTFGTICDENGLGNTIVNDYGLTTMNPNGIYLSDGPMSALVGCPLNGTWTITVQDNIAIDDGYIFEWGLNVDPSLLGHSGQIFQDFDENCTVDNFEAGIENLYVLINPGNYIVETDNVGAWYIDNLPIGTYTATVDTTNSWVATCSPSVSFTVTYPDVFVETTPVGLINENPCVEPDVSVFTSTLTNCQNEVVYVDVCNQITATDIIDSAWVEVQLDSLMSFVSASIPHIDLGGGLYSFFVDDLYPDQCANFTINVFIDCNATLGITLCTEANLYPVEICSLDTIPNTNIPGVEPCTLPWDNSSLEVNGWCQNDSVYFSIYNTGDQGFDDMECYAPVMVYLDGILVFFDSIMIQGGETVYYSFAGNGQTWILTADQHPLHPGNSNPNAHVELCGNMANWTPNLVNNFPQNDADPVVDIYCGVVTQPYDPNDKQGFPNGLTSNHYVETNQQMQYYIRFQNTGTDTAITVIIRDTLDPNLNVFTVVPGVSSHPYEFKVYGPSVLEWTFENIMLPDSIVDEPGSKGFVSFHVEQVPNLAPGTIFYNDADIYFDFNLPIITNETFHEIQDDAFFGALSVESITPDNGTIKVYPNPATQMINIHSENGTIDVIKLYDISAKMLRSIEGGSVDKQIDTSDLDNGVYIIAVKTIKGYTSVRMIKQ